MSADTMLVVRDRVNLRKPWKSIVELRGESGQWFESTTAHRSARISMARCDELSSYLRVFPYPCFPRKEYTWPPSSYPTVNS